jgi:hypothetical protein
MALKQITAKDLAATVEKKGLTLTNESKDKVFRLYHNGRKTKIWTKVSHDKKKVYSFNNDLLPQVKLQLGFRTNSELRRFLDCRMSESDYRSLLVKRSLIQPP